MARIGFIGLGAMGSRMAGRLMDAGHQLAVWNRSSSASLATLAGRGAVLASSPRGAAAGADVIISMVRDDEASRSVWLDQSNGALAATGTGALVVEASTLTPGWSREWARMALDCGAMPVEAPVVGSRPQAEAGQLAVLAAGTDGAVDRFKPIAAAYATAIHHVGGTGKSAELKLAVNALLSVQMATLAELFGWLNKADHALPRVLEVLRSLPVMSPSAAAGAASMVNGAYAPLYPVELVQKDLNYAASAAGSAGAPIPQTACARETFRLARDLGFGAAHLTVVAKVFVE